MQRLWKKRKVPSQNHAGGVARTAHLMLRLAGLGTLTLIYPMEYLFVEDAEAWEYSSIAMILRKGQIR